MGILLRFLTWFVLKRYTRLPEAYQNLTSPVSYLKARAFDYLVRQLSRLDWLIVIGISLFFCIFALEAIGMMVYVVKILGEQVGLLSSQMHDFGAINRFASFGLSSILFWVLSLLGCIGSLVVWLVVCLRRIIVKQEPSASAYRSVFTLLLASITLHVLAFVIA